MLCCCIVYLFRFDLTFFNVSLEITIIVMVLRYLIFVFYFNKCQISLIFKEFAFKFINLRSW